MEIIGETVYLTARDRQTHIHLSQENIHHSANFSEFTLKAIGSMPIIMAPINMKVGILGKVLGAFPDISQILITKNAAGDYVFSFRVASNGLTTGSYLQDIQMATNGAASVIGVTGRWEKDNEGWRNVKR